MVVRVAGYFTETSISVCDKIETLFVDLAWGYFFFHIYTYILWCMRSLMYIWVCARTRLQCTIVKEFGSRWPTNNCIVFTNEQIWKEKGGGEKRTEEKIRCKSRCYRWGNETGKYCSLWCFFLWKRCKNVSCSHECGFWFSCCRRRKNFRSIRFISLWIIIIIMMMVMICWKIYDDNDGRGTIIILTEEKQVDKPNNA